MTQEQIIAEGMNKSYLQLKEEYDILKSGIRQYFSRMLMGYGQDNPLRKSYPIFRNREYFGLGDLEMPWVDVMYQVNDGRIYIHIEGNDDYTWSELGEFDTDDLVDFIYHIENQ